MSKHHAAFPFILVTLFIDSLGIGLLLTILPDFVKQFVVDDKMRALVVGVLTAIYAGMQFLFSPALGALSDRYGRRPVLLISLFGTALDYLLFAAAGNLVWFFLARVLSGLTGANFTVAYAYVADVSAPEKRAQRFGMLSAAFAIGYVAGPPLGGWLFTLDPRMPYYAAAGLALLNWLYGYFVLPESHKLENRVALSWARLNPFVHLMNIGRFPLLSNLIAALVLSTLAFQILTSTWVLYTGFKFKWNPLDNGVAIAAMAVLVAGVQVGFIRILLRWLGERRLVIVGGVAAVASYLILGASTTAAMVYPVGLTLALASVTEPTARALLSNEIGEQDQGAINGAINSLASLTNVVAPILGSFVLAQVIPLGSSSALAGAPLYLCAILTLLAIVLVIRSFARHPQVQGVKSS